jgi:CubicO group peptidase (beta-lactamase class C family)
MLRPGPVSRLALTSAVVATLGLVTMRTTTGQGTPSVTMTPARFEDEHRKAKLSSAFPDVARVFARFAEASKVPGIAYGILVDGELAASGGLGVRELDAKSPVDVDTVFRIASMTKSFTAISILRLRDDGKLSLDDPVEKYVPELAGLVYPTQDSPKMTIRHLLSHAEGFPEDNPWGDRQLARTDAEISAMMRAGIPFSNPPGLAYEYSNYGFAILGQVVSRVSGMPYREFVQSRILKPLGMRATTLQAAEVPPRQLARGYRLQDGAWIEEPALPDGAFGAMGGMLTSTRDLAKYVGFLMGAWPPRDGPETGPIRRSSAREMQQVWRPAPALVTRDSVDAPLRLIEGGYGFGLRVSQTCGFSHVVSHGGGLPGFGSHMRWYPEHGVAIIAMGNLTYTSWGRVADEVAELLARTGGMQPRIPQPSRALVEARDGVSRLVQTWDDALADRLAADNLYLDDSKDRRRAQFERLRVRHGACRVEGGIDAENALRGAWTMPCERGSVRVAITLAPTMPPRVQFLSAASIMPLDSRLAGWAASIAEMISTREVERLTDMLAASVDTDQIRAQVLASSSWGACRVGPVRDGDGVLSATVRLNCTRGNLDLSLAVDDRAGRVSRLRLVPASGGTCVP